MLTFLRYLPFLAILAVAAVVTSLDSNSLFQIEPHVPLLLLSALLLYGVFMLRGLVWWHFLSCRNVDIGIRQALVSMSLTVLTKYVPGKVWPMLSIAAQTERSNASFRDSLLYALWYQLTISVASLFVGCIALLAIANAPLVGYLIPLVLLWLAGRALESDRIGRHVLAPLARRTGMSAKGINSGATVLLMEHAVQWLLLSAAYYAFFASVGHQLSPLLVTLQPVANTVGAVVPFTPAGLGSREAAAVAYLAPFLDTLGDALVLVTISRAWFLAVEIAVFLTGMVLDRIEPRATGAG